MNYEYMTIYMDDTYDWLDRLNTCGAKGWRVIRVIPRKNKSWDSNGALLLERVTDEV